MLVTTQREVWPLQPLPRPLLSYTGFILYKSCARNHNCCRSRCTAYVIPPCLLTHFLPRPLDVPWPSRWRSSCLEGTWADASSSWCHCDLATATSPLRPLWWTVASHWGPHKYFLKLLLLGYPIPATKQVTKKPPFKTNYLLQLNLGVRPEEETLRIICVFGQSITRSKFLGCSLEGEGFRFWMRSFWTWGIVTP